MSALRQVRCDGCSLVVTEEGDGPTAPMIGLYVERFEPRPPSRPGRKRRLRPRAYAELDLCASCVAKPVNVLELFEKHAVGAGDEDDA